MLKEKPLTLGSPMRGNGKEMLILAGGFRCSGKCVLDANHLLMVIDMEPLADLAGVISIKPRLHSLERHVRWDFYTTISLRQS